MDQRLVTLKLVLDELGVAPDIGRLDDRKRIQKAVYLGQRAGVDLGYRFGWYLMGPYSPALTRDYFALADAISSGDEEFESFSLRGAAKEALRRAAPIFEKPSAVELAPEAWLEVLASLDYLRRVSKLPPAEARAALADRKPHLSAYIAYAEQVLQDAHLPN